jgi:xanthine dehydrogenase YagR molybdenum-binding subunit
VHRDVYINAGQQRAMRAPGHPQGCFVTEMLMDELADRVRMDPVEFRLRNLPPQAPNAMWREYFRIGAQRFGWDRRHPTGDPSEGSSAAWAARPTAGAAAAAARAPSATSCRTAAS